ncbi:hypothetical protein BJP05_06250 [Corynebacterium sp. NML98-0116]|uniref:hypothetical protein n=1 Tax=Corynebacterium sp. NML98-0116 TaxID=702967 RepID=UPI000878D50F|nr:hypothetical protein [Corynebacterium sp. NML98-0116]AOX05792.1 hypothetical protein BJP05_06250 [Corynebacterium sp. NML98-0116]
MSKTSTPDLRVHGIDYARAVALAAMIFAHLTHPAGVTGQLLYGFPAATFAFLAGISMELMARRAQAVGGEAVARCRHGFYVRGTLLIVLHVLLVPFAGDIEVVLLVFGICYLCLATLPHWPTARLGLLLAGLLFASAATTALGTVVALPAAVFGAPYPVFSWAALMVAGMVSWRVILHHPWRRWVAVIIAAAVLPAVIAARLHLNTAGAGLFIAAIDPNGHTGGLISVISECAVAAGITALCLILAQFVPFGCDMGRMPLTVYCAHVVTANGHSGVVYAVLTLAVAFAFAVLWRSFYARGPLEAAMRMVVARATRTDLPPLQH